MQNLTIYLKNSKWQQEDIERLYTELKSYIQQKNIVVLPLYIPILENLPQICSSEDHVKFKPLLNKLIDEFKKSSKTQNPLYKETLSNITSKLDRIITTLPPN